MSAVIGRQPQARQRIDDTRRVHRATAKLGFAIKKLSKITGILCLLGATILAYAGDSTKFIVKGINPTYRKACEQQIATTQKLMPYLSDRDPMVTARLMRQEIYKALQPFGYYTPDVTFSVQNEDPLVINYQVDLGQPVIVHSIRISTTGKQPEDERLRRLLNSPRLERGSIFNATEYRQEKNRIITSIRNLGYIDADLNKSHVNVDGEKRTADIDLVVSVGQLYRFGSIDYIDNPPLYKEFLNLYSPFHTQDPFSIQKIGQFEENLQRSGYFDFVSVEHKPDPKDERIIDTFVHTQSRPKTRYQLGFGYDTLDHLRLLLGTQMKPINRSGHSINSQFKLAENDTDIVVHYNIPSDTPLSKNYVITGKLQTKLKTEAGNSNSGELKFTQMIARHGLKHWLAAHVLREHSEPDDADDYYSTLLYPSYTLGIPIGEATHADGIIEWTLLGTAEAMGSTVNLVQSNVTWRYVFPHFDAPIRLINHGEAGFTVTNDFDEVPLSMQYVTGGSQSIRSVSSDSIGPGHYLTVFGFDAQSKIPNTSWYVGPFVDFGNAFDDPDGLVTSSGIGFSWHSSIGDISLNVGRRIDQHASLQLQISIIPMINIMSSTSSLSN